MLKQEEAVEEEGVTFSESRQQRSIKDALYGLSGVREWICMIGSYVDHMNIKLLPCLPELP